MKGMIMKVVEKKETSAKVVQRFLGKLCSLYFLYVNNLYSYLSEKTFPEYG